ncbi:MAG: protein-glutamine gamma-glutamyltransferase [Oscillospiraceae bacterium]|jgi:protein-glutamine gamma-glutamyltransferase|nr:protein-glutamine gamma-glutamyltransferase [Oscillospiraceae bacterium]
MIYIGGSPAGFAALARGYPARSIEYICLYRLSKSAHGCSYSSREELVFELAMRRATVSRAERLRRSGLNFKTFKGSFCNARYWRRDPDGGFELRRGAGPSAAVRDIYENGRAYGTECAAAMQIVYYGALMDTLPDGVFDRSFTAPPGGMRARRGEGGIRLRDWRDISATLRETGEMRRARDFLPGDRRYFANPDVSLAGPEWQGENVIDMGDGTYYGHGVGRRGAGEIIEMLNRARRRGARRGAYLVAAAGRPDYKKLYALSSGGYI